MNKDGLGMELSKVLFKHEPTLLACDLNASARAAAEVANLLGCILATVLAKKGQDAYVEAVHAAAMKAHATAVRTANNAYAKSQEPSNWTRQ